MQSDSFRTCQLTALVHSSVEEREGRFNIFVFQYSDHCEPVQNRCEGNQSGLYKLCWKETQVSATASFSSSILLYAHLRIAGRLIARGRTKPRRTMLLNQDRKIPGFRSHQTALRTRFLSLSLSLSPSPHLAHINEKPINLDPVARIMCVATKALTHYLLLSLSLSLSLFPFLDRAFPPRPSFLRYSSHRTSSCVPLARNRTQI